MFAVLLALSSLLALPSAAETTLGVLVFSRHGDRTAKFFPPTALTNLGANQVVQSGGFFRSTYIEDGAPKQILNISANVWSTPQIFAAAPDQNLLSNTATAFLQGLYPPNLSDPAALQLLANGSEVGTPLGGYQYVVLHTENADAPETIWLEGDVGCPTWTAASQTYFQSQQYASTLASTQSFYQEFVPILEGVLPAANVSFQNAYTVFDLLNVGTIHNSTIAKAVSADQLFQLRTLADSHEFSLTYNQTLPLRSLPGQAFIGKVLSQLNQTLTTTTGPKFSLLVSSYDVFQAFFGLANLTSASSDFFGLPNYAAAMSFELVTNATVTTSLPDPSEVSVRFLFRNGSDAGTPFQAFPLFLNGDELMPWATFSQKMSALQVSTAAQWCTICGNSTMPFCPAKAKPVVAAKSMKLSSPVSGVVGAVVTLGVIGLGVIVAAFLGVRLRRAGSRSAPMLPVANTTEKTKRAPSDSASSHT